MLLIALALCRHARAQDAGTEPTSALQRALRAYEAGDMAVAQREFEQAHAEQPTARTLRGLGVVAYRQGRWVDAYAYLGLSLASTEKPLTDELRARVLVLVDEVGAKIERVHFQLTPAHAELRIDDVPPRDDASGAVLVLPGSHRASLEAPGYVSSVWTFEARAGSEQMRSWQLAPAPPRAAPTVAKTAAKAPATGDSTPARSGPTPGALRRWGYGALALTAVGLVVTSVALGLGVQRLNVIEDQCRKMPGDQCTPDQADAFSQDARLNLLSGLTIGGAIATGVGAGASAWLLISARRSEQRASGSVEIGLGMRSLF